MRAPMISRHHHGLMPLFQLVAICAFVLMTMPTPVAAADDVEAALHKANTYIEVAKTTERAVDSWDRYASWVDMKTGPTGKEEYIQYGMYELHDVEGLLKETGAVAGAAPAAEKLDAAMARYLNAYQALAPSFNEAAAYYDSKGYEADKAAKGQALHKTMVPLAAAFLAEREAMMPELRAFVREVEGQQLAATEAREGRTAAWHASNVMHAANRVFDLFPRVRPQPMDSAALEAEIKALGPDTTPEKFEQVMAGTTVPKTPPIEVKAYGAALDDYAKAVEAFGSYSGEEPDDFDELKPLPAKLLEKLRAYHEPLKKSDGHPFEGDGQMASQIVQTYFDMLNASSPIMGSYLRYLP